jgi:DNA-binding beta-propeller fold protein YncE
MPSIVTVAIVLLASNTLVTAASRAESSTYHISMVVPLGPPDRWDYVVFDPDTRRVYVAHGDRVTVVDGTNGRVVGTVEGMPGGTHGVAVSHATGTGYTDDGKAGVVVEFDLTKLKVLKRIKAEADADGIVFDPASGHIFVIDGDSGKLTVIDPKTV